MQSIGMCFKHLGRSLVVPWVSFWRPWGRLRVLRRLQRVLGEEPNATETTEGSLGVSGEGSGGSLG